MSSQPTPITQHSRGEAERAELLKKQAAQARRSDGLYIAGAVLFAVGLGWIRIYLAPIALGCFCLLFPLLELATGFIRGLRAPHVSPGRR
jgi:predicted acyltransferase